MNELTEQEKRKLVEGAVNAAVYHIQEAIETDGGDFASIWFDGDTRLHKILGEYLQAELDNPKILTLTETRKAAGTHLVGQINSSFSALRNTFGEPHLHTESGGKTDADWVLEFYDGTIATIYNWKDGYNYLGSDEGTDVYYIENWSIGGFNSSAVTRVNSALATSNKPMVARVLGGRAAWHSKEDIW